MLLPSRLLRCFRARLLFGRLRSGGIVRVVGAGCLGWDGYLFGVEVYFVAGHVLCETEDLHLLLDGGLDDFLEGIFGMAWAELP